MLVFYCPQNVLPGVHTDRAEMASSSDCRQAVRLDFDMGGTRTPKPKPGASRDRPWRKSAEAVAAERQEARRLLGASGGVDLAALRYALQVQEAIDATDAMHEDVQQAATQLLQAATNACSAQDVAVARAAVERAVEAAAGLALAVAMPRVAQSLSGLPRLQLLHQVMPRLWLGGWAALNNVRTLPRTHSTHRGDTPRHPCAPPSPRAFHA